MDKISKPGFFSRVEELQVEDESVFGDGNLFELRARITEQYKKSVENKKKQKEKQEKQEKLAKQQEKLKRSKKIVEQSTTISQLSTLSWDSEKSEEGGIESLDDYIDSPEPPLIDKCPNFRQFEAIAAGAQLEKRIADPPGRYK